MFIPQTRYIVIIGAFVAVSALAAVGWMRSNNAPSYPAPIAAQYDPAMPNAQGYAPQAIVNTAGADPVYSTDGYYPSRSRPIYIRQREVVQVVQPAPRNVYQEQEYYTDSHGRRRGRSKTHSVEIVAGTAAVGAAIGAIAGGGKGAAIGAVSGGGAGFVYDRITHDH